MWTSTRVALVTHCDSERPDLRDIPVLLERARREVDGAETDVRLVRVDVIRDEVGELRVLHRGGVASRWAAFFGRHELSLLGAFLLLEACNGLYVPSMGYQRSQVVSDARRASVYGFMNIPLFVFVALALITTNREGQGK